MGLTFFNLWDLTLIPGREIQNLIELLNSVKAGVSEIKSEQKHNISIITESWTIPWEGKENLV